MPQPGGRPLGGRLTGSREGRGKRPWRGGQHLLSLQCPYPWRRRLHTLRRGHPTQVMGRHPDEGPHRQPLNTTVILPVRAAMSLPKAGVPGRFPRQGSQSTMVSEQLPGEPHNTCRGSAKFDSNFKLFIRLLVLTKCCNNKTYSSMVFAKI